MRQSCKVCNSKSKIIFTKRILNKYSVKYFQCTKCDFIFTETPFWLKEAYKNPINITDTGILARNINFSKTTAVLIYFFFDKESSFVDYSGGYGTMTRLMRDIGFDFYWDDPMTQNIFAKTFENKKGNKVELVTAFECFEHYNNPIVEINEMLKMSKNILFSTELIDKQKINSNWWYWGLEHGQHIAFYSEKTLNTIANNHNLNYYNLGGVGILTKKSLNKIYLSFIHKYSDIFFHYVQKKMDSLTFIDMKNIINE